MKSLIGLLIGSVLLAHGQQRPSRIHTATEAGTLRIIPADQTPPAASDVTIREKSGDRRVEANGIPDHEVGLFPNRGNPHEIKEQRYRFELEANPKPNRTSEPLHKEQERDTRGAPNMPFGIAINGVSNLVNFGITAQPTTALPSPTETFQQRCSPLRHRQ